MSLPSQEGLYRFVVCQSGDPDRIADHYGLPFGDPQLMDLLKSMVVSGFLRGDPVRGYQQGNPLPAGPAAAGRGAATAAEPGSRFGDQPVGVLPAGTGGEQNDPPPEMTSKHKRYMQGQHAASLLDLLQAARNARECLEDYEDEDVPERLLQELLKQIGQITTEAGFTDFGEVGDEVTFDPEWHDYSGIVPDSGLTGTVMIYRTGVVWRCGDEVAVISKAWVELYDDDLGAYAFIKADDLEGEDLPDMDVLFLDDSPYKPSDYDDAKAQDPSLGGYGMWTVTDVRRCEGDAAECAGDDCNGVLLFFTGDADRLHVPGDLPMQTFSNYRY